MTLDPPGPLRTARTAARRHWPQSTVQSPSQTHFGVWKVSPPSFSKFRKTLADGVEPGIAPLPLSAHASRARINSPLIVTVVEAHAEKGATPSLLETTLSKIGQLQEGAGLPWTSLLSLVDQSRLLGCIAASVPTCMAISARPLQLVCETLLFFLLVDFG